MHRRMVQILTPHNRAVLTKLDQYAQTPTQENAQIFWTAIKDAVLSKKNAVYQKQIYAFNQVTGYATMNRQFTDER